MLWLNLFTIVTNKFVFLHLNLLNIAVNKFHAISKLISAKPNQNKTKIKTPKLNQSKPNQTPLYQTS